MIIVFIYYIEPVRTNLVASLKFILEYIIDEKIGDIMARVYSEQSTERMLKRLQRIFGNLPFYLSI